LTSSEGGEGEPFSAEKLGFLKIIFIPWFSLYLRLNKQKLNPNGLLTHIKLSAVKPQT
jgi:hypothetical protein